MKPLNASARRGKQVDLNANCAASEHRLARLWNQSGPPNFVYSISKHQACEERTLCGRQRSTRYQIEQSVTLHFTRG